MVCVVIAFVVGVVSMCVGGGCCIYMNLAVVHRRRCSLVPRPNAPQLRCIGCGHETSDAAPICMGEGWRTCTRREEAERTKSA